MKTRENTLKRMVEELGSAMMVAWTLLLGPVGAIPLLVMAYAIFTQNLALGIVCGLFAFTPLMLTVAWAPFSWTVILSEAAAAARRPASDGQAFAKR